MLKRVLDIKLTNLNMEDRSVCLSSSSRSLINKLLYLLCGKGWSFFVNYGIFFDHTFDHTFLEVNIIC